MHSIKMLIKTCCCDDHLNIIMHMCICGAVPVVKSQMIFFLFFLLDKAFYPLCVTVTGTMGDFQTFSPALCVGSLEKK